MRRVGHVWYNPIDTDFDFRFQLYSIFDFKKYDECSILDFKI